MQIIKDKDFLRQMKSLLAYIALDKKSAASAFNSELEAKFSLLKSTPYTYRKSIYFEDESYRDLIFKGYTIIYKIENERILILEVFKWQAR